MTHCRRALDYYNRAVRIAPSNWALQQELAELLLRLRSFDAADRVGH